MYHAACKVEFQSFNRSYSHLTFSKFFKNLESTCLTLFFEYWRNPIKNVKPRTTHRLPRKLRRFFLNIHSTRLDLRGSQREREEILERKIKKGNDKTAAVYYLTLQKHNNSSDSIAVAVPYRGIAWVVGGCRGKSVAFRGIL